MRSRASLAIGGAGSTGVAKAGSPQRWNVTRRANGETEAIHQFIGDGVFGGDLHSTGIAAAGNARVTVRSVAATSLRGRGASAHFVRLSARDEAQVRYLPGAIIPHAGADHRASLRVDVTGNAGVIAAAILVRGREGMGERDAWERMRMRTRLSVAGKLAFAEEVEVVPGEAVRSGGGFAGGGAIVAVFALGCVDAAEPEWWTRVAAPDGVAGGATALRSGGAVFRGLCSTLGDAQRLLAAVEEAADGDGGRSRKNLEVNFCSSVRRTGETITSYRA